MGMKIAVQTLNTDYLNSHFSGAISKDEPDKNINDLNIFISNGKLNVMWKDCDDQHWKANHITKLKNQIPSSAFDNAVIETYDVKNSHKDFPFVDGNIQVDTLYCYRIFTEFDNSDQLYSGFKNVFFIYVYDPDDCDKPHIGDDVIAAGMILQDAEHKFVTDTQIANWDNKIDKDATYTKDEIIELLDDQSKYVVTETQNGMMTPEMLLKLSLLENYVHPLTHPVDMITGLADIAISGDYNDLANKPELATIATTGSYNDLLDKPDIPDTNKLADVAITGDYNDLANRPTLSTVAFTGNYDDLLNLPTVSDPTKLAKVASTGDYNDLINAPVVPTFSQVAVSGSYNDLLDKPNIPNFSDVATSGSYSDLVDRPTFADVAFSGDYNDLKNIPSSTGSSDNLATVATSGSYNDLLNKPTLSTVATSGSYNDLLDKPNIPSDLSSLGRVAFSNDYSDLDNIPNYAAVAASGSYNDLENKPDIPVIIKKGTANYSGSTGTEITIPTQDSTDYVVSISNSENPGGNLGEVYFEKSTNKFIVYNSGSATTKFDYLVLQ